MKVFLNFLILIMFFSFAAESSLCSPKTDSIRAERKANKEIDTLKSNLIKAYNKFIKFQSTDDYKRIMKLEDGKVQEKLITKAVDSIAKSSGMKGSKEFFDAEAVYAHDPMVKRLGSRINNNANRALKGIEEQNSVQVLDSAKIKENTILLKKYYEQLNKWTLSKEFKELDKITDEKELNIAIDNYLEQVVKSLNTNKKDIRLFEAKHRLSDEDIIKNKREYNKAVSQLRLKFKKERVPKVKPEEIKIPK